MNIFNKTQLEQDLDAIQAATDKTILVLSAASDSLNQTYKTFWNLPDDRLLAVLNYLGTEKVTEVFTEHNNTANALIASQEGQGVQAINTPAKQLNVVDGQFVIVYPTVEEPTPEPIDLPE